MKLFIMLILTGYCLIRVSRSHHREWDFTTGLVLGAVLGEIMMMVAE